MNVVQNSGTGLPVVFIHGNSLASGTWVAQLEAPALAHLRTVAVDLPGHGDSDHYPLAQRYAMHHFANTVAAFVRALGTDVVLVGHSLGGHIAMRVPALAANVKAIALVSTPPLSGVADFAHAFLPVPELAKMFSAELKEEEVQACATGLTWPNSSHAADIARMIKDTDPRVRADMGFEIASGQAADEPALIKAAGIPVLMVHGAQDAFLSLPYLEGHAPLFWRGRVHSIAGAGHTPQLQQPEAFNQLLISFLEAHA